MVINKTSKKLAINKRTMTERLKRIKWLTFWIISRNKNLQIYEKNPGRERERSNEEWNEKKLIVSSKEDKRRRKKKQENETVGKGVNEGNAVKAGKKYQSEHIKERRKRG